MSFCKNTLEEKPGFSQNAFVVIAFKTQNIFYKFLYLGMNELKC